MTDRIEIDPDVMAGKPVVEGTRIPVEKIIHLLANGLGFGDITDEYPGLEEEDIRAALEYAAETLEDEEVFGIEGEDVEVRS